MATATGAGVPGPWLMPLARRSWVGQRYALSAGAHEALAAVLARLDMAADHPRIVFGYTAKATAFVLGRRITVDRRRYAALSAEQQRALLVHELVHVAQYAALGRAGLARFLVRYLPEYHGDPHNYRVPDALAATPLAQVSLLDPHYTLDQIAERFRHEYARRG